MKKLFSNIWITLWTNEKLLLFLLMFLAYCCSSYSTFIDIATCNEISFFFLLDFFAIRFAFIPIEQFSVRNIRFWKWITCQHHFLSQYCWGCVIKKTLLQLISKYVWNTLVVFQSTPNYMFAHYFNQILCSCFIWFLYGLCNSFTSLISNSILYIGFSLRF